MQVTLHCNRKDSLINVLFVVAEANEQEREQIVEAIFDLSREETVERVEAGKIGKKALAAHDHVYDVLEPI